MDEANEKSIWLDQETLTLLDKYRATQAPIPTKKDALRDLVRFGWLAVSKKKKPAGEVKKATGRIPGEVQS